eukprot:11655156-Alexandrium_andersonii.AAC.1
MKRPPCEPPWTGFNLAHRANLAGIFASQGAQSAIRNPHKGKTQTSLQAFKPGTARAQERRQIGPRS